MMSHLTPGFVTQTYTVRFRMNDGTTHEISLPIDCRENVRCQYLLINSDQNF
jgi:hypothetical protein